MKMKAKYIATCLAAASLVGLCTTTYAMGSKPDSESMEMKAPMEFVYVCPDCHTTALKPGTCPMCKKELTKRHLLGTKDGQAMLCACPDDCKCDYKGVKDGKCACGKPVEMAACKGMYACPKGCPFISATPGKCACGMEMKKIE